MSESSHKNDLFLLYVEVLGYSERLYEGFSADFISCDPVRIQILACRTSKIMSEVFHVCVKVCNLFCNYSEYKSKEKTFDVNYYTGKQNI